MRKSSRGNPWHDAKGRFCHGPTSEIDTFGNPVTEEQRRAAVTSSEKTPEEYAERTLMREIADNHRKHIAEYESRIERASSAEELESIANEALNDIGVSDVEYCDIYNKALRKVRYTNTPRFYESDSREFSEFFNNSRESHPLKTRWRVSTDYSENDYDTMNLYLADDGASFAVHNGDIVSVCTVNGGTTRGSQLLQKAVEQGGTKLDAYSGIFGFYVHNGFEPVSICKWDDEYAPDDWIKANGFTDDSWKSKDDKDFICKREDIVFFKYTGRDSDITFNEWKASVKYDDDYDAAQKRRDDSLSTTQG